MEAFPELASEEMNPVEVTDEMREKMRASQRKEEKEEKMEETRRDQLTSVVSVRVVVLSLIEEILVPSGRVLSSELSSLAGSKSIGLGGEGGRVETSRVVSVAGVGL